MTNYPLGDFLIQVKNASLINRRNIAVPKTNLVYQTALALKRTGYLDEVELNNNILNVALSFHKKEPKLIDLKLVSKPGLRRYIDTSELSKKKGSSIYLISTPHGILNTKEALKKGAGGEVIAEIW